MDAPKRIWIDPRGGVWVGADNAQEDHGDVGYILVAEHERIVAERDRLREALRPFAAIPDPAGPTAWLPEHPVWGRNGVVITVGDFAEARAAFGSTGDTD